MYEKKYSYQIIKNKNDYKFKILKKPQKFFEKLKKVILFFAFLFYFLSFKLNLDSTNSIIIKSQIHNNLNQSIKVAYYCNCIKYGGVERIIALLINKLSDIRLFKQYLITNLKPQEGEYIIPNNTVRLSLIEQNMNLIEIIKREQIDILIYNFYKKKEMFELTKLNGTKTIFFDHSSVFFWIYRGEINFNYSFYSLYKKSKYVISLIPFENDFLFKKWGINSILMDNLNTYEYDSVFPSDLKGNNIIMAGRGNDNFKRFDLGIKAMINIIKEIPDALMNIISTPVLKLVQLIRSFKLNDNVKFIGYQNDPSIYYKNSSLHILPSLSESYSMVLAEAKIFGIPSIICGLDFLVLSKGGTVILYDDDPDIIAKESIKILKNDRYRKKLGKEARKSMKNRKNKYIVNRWINLLSAIYNGVQFHDKISESISEKEINLILNNQLNLLKKRMLMFREKSIEDLRALLLNML